MIIKSKQFTEFATVKNSVCRDSNLSLKAKGLFLVLASLPADWVIYKTQLQSFSKDSRDATISAFDELVKKNYILAIKKVRPNGTFLGWDYVVYPEPQVSSEHSPITEIPKSDSPKSETPELTNKDCTKKYITNKHTLSNLEKNSSDRVLSTAVDSNTTKPKGKPKPQELPKWLTRINGTITDRFKAFEKLVNETAKRDNVDAEIAEQLITKYGADDKEWDGYMRFETFQYFDCSLLLRNFEANRRTFGT